MKTPDTINNSQRTPTEMNKKNAIPKVRIGTVRYLKTFTIIFNEMPVLLCVLC